VSHAEDVALIAVARSQEVGVDVERIVQLDTEALVEQFFSPAERAALRALAPASKVRGFFDAWTRKEAYIKALGLGLAKPLDSFDVTLGPHHPARLLRDRDDPRANERWRLESLPVGEGFAAALAIEAYDSLVLLLDHP
jgi:4'-phosphopantetheinyl transferase